MDFYELNKIMNDEYQCNEQSPVAMSTQMQQPQVRVYKHSNGKYDVFANFTTVKEAVAYMRNWNPNQMQNWYIIDANDNRLRMNDQGKLVVFNSLIGY